MMENVSFHACNDFEQQKVENCQLLGEASLPHTQLDGAVFSFSVSTNNGGLDKMPMALFA